MQFYIEEKKITKIDHGSTDGEFTVPNKILNLCKDDSFTLRLQWSRLRLPMLQLPTYTFKKLRLRKFYLIKFRELYHCSQVAIEYNSTVAYDTI